MSKLKKKINKSNLQSALFLRLRKSLLLGNSKGMTIVEILVAMTIFVVVMTIAVASFTSITRFSSQAHTMSNVQQNARILSEQLSRLARSATAYKVTDGGVLDQISFTDQSENNICFKAVSANPTQIKKYNNKDCDDPGFSLTGDDTNVERMNFTEHSASEAYLDIEIWMNAATADGSIDDNPIKINTTVVLGGLK